MLFSLVTPVLNGAQFLNETITSILSQSHGAFEYRIIDGGSTDGSIEIAEKAARGDSRLKVVVQEGLGLYSSIALGLDASEGHFLAWINADDVYAPWALSAIAQFARHRREAQWISGLPGCWDADGVLRFVKAEAWRPRLLIRQGWFHKDLLGFIQQESVFFRHDLYNCRSAAERSAFEQAQLAGDFILWKQFATRAPLTTLPTALGGFRRHGANRSIAQMKEYMAEVRAAGAVFLPKRAARLVRTLYARQSAICAGRLAEAEDAAVFSQP